MGKDLKSLKRNTILIAIANIGSRAISFILAPLYSHYLATGQYGTMDLITTTCSLLTPLMCLDIYEATYRFTKDAKYNNKSVITTSLYICFIEIVLSLLLLAVYSIFRPLSIVILICAISAILDAIYSILVQYARGQDKVSIFAFSGVLSSIIVLISNILFMLALRLELDGWIISFVLSKVLVLIYLVIRLKLWRELSVKLFNKEFLREGLKFSLPLMPSASMWWIMNASDRYILTAFWGAGLNGVYAAATKFPSVLSVFENVFYQAWQSTAIDSMKESDRDSFFSVVFANYFRLFAVGVSGILLVLKPMLFTLFDKDYRDGWMCAAILVVGVMIHALVGNLGVLYTVFKDTKGALKTSFIGAVTNIVLNLIFIPFYGLNAAALTTLIGYLVVLIVRWFDIKKYVKLSFPIHKEWLTIVLVSIQFFLYYVPGLLSYLIRFIILLLCFYMNRKLIIKILKKQ